MLKKIRKLRTYSLRDDERGSVMVETALGLPILLSVVIGTLELANYFFIANAIENAVLSASRFGIIGNGGNGVSREDQVRQIIAEQTFGRVDINTLELETRVFEQFADIGEPEPFDDENGNGIYEVGEPFTDVNGNGVWDAQLGTSGLGNAGDIVLYNVSYRADSLTGFMDWATRSITINAAVAVRNEPF